MQYRRRSTCPRQTSPREYSGQPCPMLPARLRHRYASPGQKGPSTSAMSAGHAADASTDASTGLTEASSSSCSCSCSSATGNETDPAGVVWLDTPESCDSEAVTWLRPQPTKAPPQKPRATKFTTLLDRLPTIRPARHALAAAACSRHDHDDAGKHLDEPDHENREDPGQLGSSLTVCVLALATS